MTKKVKIYLDTSVISCLQAIETPERMADTLRLWRDLEAGRYEVVISDITLDEINDCPEPKRSFMLDELKKIPLVVIESQKKVDELSQEFIRLGILKEKSMDDCRHIATALIAQCDIIVSWNFKHIVNDKTIEGVKIISKTKGFDGIKIYCPSILTGGNDED